MELKNQIRAYRTEMKLSQEELAEYGGVTEATRKLIDVANAKINAARNRLQQKHDSHWQQYMTKVNAAINDARSHALSHDELLNRVMEIDNEYWDYFKYDEQVNYWKELAKAERDSESAYEVYRTEYEQRVWEVIAQMRAGSMKLTDGRTKLNQYSTVYSFILREVINFDDANLDLAHIELLYDQYVEKYK